MVQMPRKSVTRFFIPMIDVLTLLFCIYLLMPMVRNPGQSEEERSLLEEKLRQREAELNRLRTQGQDVPTALKEEIERLRREKIQALQNRLAVRVLEIDGDTGKLYLRDDKRVEVKDQSEANELIEADRKRQGVTRKELYYMILYPRVPTGRPSEDQRKMYDRWFEGVALGYDIPGVER